MPHTIPLQILQPQQRKALDCHHISIVMWVLGQSCSRKIRIFATSQPLTIRIFRRTQISTIYRSDHSLILSGSIRCTPWHLATTIGILLINKVSKRRLHTKPFDKARSFNVVVLHSLFYYDF
jgi:hypothetical protein